MVSSPKRSAAKGRWQSHGRKRQTIKQDQEVHLITAASESVVADSDRKNRTYAILIGVRIVSVFMVLFLEGWLQIAVLVGGMLAPWIGVQIANNIRQVDPTAMTPVPPQQAALTSMNAHSPQTSPEDQTPTTVQGEYIVGSETPADSPSDIDESDPKI